MPTIIVSTSVYILSYPYIHTYRLGHMGELNEGEMYSMYSKTLLALLKHLQQVVVAAGK